MRLPWVIAVTTGCAATTEAGERIPVEPPPDVEMVAATGTLTWTVTADAGAEEAGYADCTYRRTYSALEDRSAPWLCPDCDLQLLADIEMPEPDRDCYASISGVTTPPARERLGLQGDTFLRTTAEHLLASVQGAVEDLGDGRLRVTGDPVELAVDGGTIQFVATGELVLQTVTGDPWHGLKPPERPVCGWDVHERPAYEGPYVLEVGSQLPDGLFGDACGQGLRLHDLAGQYLVIDISAADCEPCQLMAAEGLAFEEAALRRLRRVELVTLLAPSLNAPIDPTSPELLHAWSDEFSLDSPVLGDRGWGWLLVGTAFGEVSYPTWIIASPSLEVVAMGQGFGGWQPIFDTLMAHRE